MFGDLMQYRVHCYINMPGCIFVSRKVTYTFFCSNTGLYTSTSFCLLLVAAFEVCKADIHHNESVEFIIRITRL